MRAVALNAHTATVKETAEGPAARSVDDDGVMEEKRPQRGGNKDSLG
jgi:hypothetical protein